MKARLEVDGPLDITYSEDGIETPGKLHGIRIEDELVHFDIETEKLGRCEIFSNRKYTSVAGLDSGGLLVRCPMCWSFVIL